MANGLEKGAMQNKLEIVKKLLVMGVLKIEQIVEVTKLFIEKINRLKNGIIKSVFSYLKLFHFTK